MQSRTGDKPADERAPSRLHHTWIRPETFRNIINAVGTPVFVYSVGQLLMNARRIICAADKAGIGRRVKSFIPFFPNSNPHLLQPLKDLGMGVLIQVPGEYAILRRFGFEHFIASPGYLSNTEIDFWIQTGFPVFLSSLDEVAYLLEAHPDAPINVRLDSLSSDKPGVKYGQLSDLANLLTSHNKELNCFELYCGSGHSTEGMIGFLEQVFMIHRTYFPHVRAIDLAGGYGFDYAAWRQSDKHFQWDVYFEAVKRTAQKYAVSDSVDFIIEPARDLLADVGVLVLGVKRETIINPGTNQLVTDGSRVLMPSALYKNRMHNILFFDANLTELQPGELKAAIRGRGILRHEQVLPGEYRVPDGIGSGDSIVVLDAGAYCATQHMEFLNIPPAAEVLIQDSGEPLLITSRGNDLDKWRHLVNEKQPLSPTA